MNELFKYVVLFISLAIGNVIYKFCTSDPVIEPVETWWGPGDPSQQDTSLVPFKIDIPDQVLDDLSRRLRNARNFTQPLEGTHHEYGINTNLLREIVDFWLTKYDWRQREVFFNQWPQFKTNIQGLDIHYIHVKPETVPTNVKVVPLLLLNGWATSFREFYDMIPILTTPQENRNFVFEVIIPSLPGFGFSQAATKPGLGAKNMSVVINNLMKRLGFDTYYLHGNDWGEGVAAAISIFFSENVKGHHSSMCNSLTYTARLKLLIGSFWPSLVIDEKHKHRLYPLSDYFSYLMLEFGYLHIQATKPDTLGVSLNDSPVGLAAYLIDKFITMTKLEFKNRADGGLLEKYSYTDLLDNVMIYWITNSLTTSMRIYAESVSKKEFGAESRHEITVPAACAVFDHDVLYQPPAIFRDRYTNLLQINEYDGGHFPGFECPNVLAKDIWLAVSKFEKLGHP